MAALQILFYSRIVSQQVPFIKKNQFLFTLNSY